MKIKADPRMRYACFYSPMTLHRLISNHILLVFSCFLSLRLCSSLSLFYTSIGSLLDCLLLLSLFRLRLLRTIGHCAPRRTICGGCRLLLWLFLRGCNLGSQIRQEPVHALPCFIPDFLLRSIFSGGHQDSVALHKEDYVLEVLSDRFLLFKG